MYAFETRDLNFSKETDLFNSENNNDSGYIALSFSI
jgi:hypothetical protein